MINIGLLNNRKIIAKEKSKILHDYIKTAPKWDGPQIPKK